MEKNEIGLALGSFFAALHLVWALLVAIIPNAVQAYFNWIFKLHGILPIITITSITLVNAILLIIVTFIIGYIIGWAFASIFTCCGNCTKTKKKR